MDFFLMMKNIYFFHHKERMFCTEYSYIKPTTNEVVHDTFCPDVRN